jgi:hypothetical protein
VFRAEVVGSMLRPSYWTNAQGMPAERMLTEETASHKLRLVADVAEAVWG